MEIFLWNEMLLDVQPKGEDDATPLHFIAKYKKKKAVEAQSGNDDDVKHFMSISISYLS